MDVASVYRNINLAGYNINRTIWYYKMSISCRTKCKLRSVPLIKWKFYARHPIPWKRAIDWYIQYPPWNSWGRLLNNKIKTRINIIKGQGKGIIAEQNGCLYHWYRCGDDREAGRGSQERDRGAHGGGQDHEHDRDQGQQPFHTTIGTLAVYSIKGYLCFRRIFEILISANKNVHGAIFFIHSPLYVLYSHT